MTTNDKDAALRQHLPISPLTNKPQVWLTQKDALEFAERALSAQAALPPQSDAEIEALEREHFGCIEAGTGIYAPREALKEFEAVRAMCGGGK